MDKINIKELATPEWQKAQAYQAYLRVENQINRGADGFLFSVKRITNADSPYDQNINDSILICDSTAGSITINLLPALEWEQKRLTVKKIVAANTVTIDGDNAETIDGTTTKALTTQYSSYELVSEGGSIHLV